MKKLNQLKKVEWPKWYAINVEPKIAQLEALIRVNALNQLKGIWTKTCDKCGQSFDIDLTSKQIENLLRLGYIEVECQKPKLHRLIPILNMET